MASILYVETGFPIAIGKGQDAEATSLLAGSASPIRLVIPAICFMEALSVLNDERKQRGIFLERLSYQIREVGRDVLSPRARQLASRLTEAKVEIEDLLNELKDRLFQALDRLSRVAEIVPLDPAVIRDSVGGTGPNLIDDPTDNLILSTVLSHARTCPEGPKAFLSPNYHDFGQADVEKALMDANVKYFRRTEAALGWLRSQTAG